MLKDGNYPLLDTSKYFVVSCGDAPEKIYFSKQQIIDNIYDFIYIDCFNENGEHVGAYTVKSDEHDPTNQSEYYLV